jgi:ankyrin repeat protein
VSGTKISFVHETPAWRQLLDAVRSEESETDVADLIAAALALSTADINATNHHGKTVLNRVIRNSLAVERTLDAGADTEVPDLFGQTPLWNAARWDNRDAALVLLAHGAEIDTQNNTGCTPLWIAASLNNIGMVQLLLNDGANWKLANQNSVTPEEIANTNGFSAIKTIFHEAQEKKLLSDIAPPAVPIAGRTSKLKI